MNFIHVISALSVGLVFGFFIAALLSKTDDEPLREPKGEDRMRLDWINHHRMQIIMVDGGNGIAVMTKRDNDKQPKVIAVGKDLREAIDGAMARYPEAPAT